MPGRLAIGDISSDGFPDILVTIKNSNDTTQAHLLLNSPCTRHTCSLDGRDARRRTFVHSSQSAIKFLLDDEDLGDTVANDIFEGKLNFGGSEDKLEYDLTGEEYGNALDQY